MSVHDFHWWQSRLGWSIYGGTPGIRNRGCDLRDHLNEICINVGSILKDRSLRHLKRGQCVAALCDIPRPEGCCGVHCSTGRRVSLAASPTSSVTNSLDVCGLSGKLTAHAYFPNKGSSMDSYLWK